MVLGTPAREDRGHVTHHTAAHLAKPIALPPGGGEARWFLGFLVTIKSSRETTDGTVSVIDHYGVQGLGSPLHVHHNENEWFYITEGELTFWIDGDVIKAPAGSFVFGPRGIPHTHRHGQRANKNSQPRSSSSNPVEHVDRPHGGEDCQTLGPDRDQARA